MIMYNHITLVSLPFQYTCFQVWADRGGSVVAHNRIPVLIQRYMYNFFNRHYVFMYMNIIIHA